VIQLYSENLEAYTNSGWIAPNPEQTGYEFDAPNLSIAYPNPFNPITHIQFNLPENAKVKLVVYNIQGKEIRELVNGFKTAGSYSVDFDGTSLASGVYFYKIDISNLKGKFTNVKRMVLVK